MFSLRLLPGVTLALGLLLSGFCLVSQAQEESRSARPNILFAIADDWNNHHAGVLGCSWVETPAFDRVANEGTLFVNAFTSNPKCSPCRASILTGRNTWQLEEACCHFGIFPNTYPVYTEVLAENDYHVGYTGKGWGPGDFEAGGFTQNPAGPGYNRLKARPPHSGMSNNDYAGNFADFLAKRPDGQPFCFWYGASEPHRRYQAGIGVAAGKDPSEVELPPYYPDSREIREDFLDYAVEVEHFDQHLGLMIDQLEEIGELDNTLIVVTSDHGMPFPRIKGQIYEDGFHLPLAMRWGTQMKPGRTVTDFVNVRDFAPTFLEVAGVEVAESMTGSSLVGIITSTESGQIDMSRNRMLIGKERHDLGRPFDQGYPVRAIRTEEYLYIRNYEPDRWPVGNPETGYRNCDGSPTKSLILSKFDQNYQLCFGKRPGEELYRITEDPDCVNNLATDPKFFALKRTMRLEMERKLREEGDLRMFGLGDRFEAYQYVGQRGHSYENYLKNRGDR